jgi:hypothetical protein
MRHGRAAHPRWKLAGGSNAPDAVRTAAPSVLGFPPGVAGATEHLLAAVAEEPPLGRAPALLADVVVSSLHRNKSTEPIPRPQPSQPTATSHQVTPQVFPKKCFPIRVSDFGKHRDAGPESTAHGKPPSVSRFGVSRSASFRSRIRGNTGNGRNTSVFPKRQFRRVWETAETVGKRLNEPDRPGRNFSLAERESIRLLSIRRRRQQGPST